MKENQIFLQIIKISVYLSLLTPLVISRSFYFPFVGPKSLYFMALSEIIFFSWLILISFDPNYRPRKNPLLISLIIYLFVFSLSTFFGENPSFSFWSKHERMTGLLMQLHLFVYFLVLSSTFREEEFKRFFVFSIIVAIFGGIFAILNVENKVMRGGGTIGNESFLGTYLLFNCFFAIYLYLSSLDWKKTFGIFAFFILFLSLLFCGVYLEGESFSRIPFLALFKSGARAAKISLYGGLIILFLCWVITSKRKIFKILASFILLSSFLLGSFAIYSVIFQNESFFRKLAEKELGTFGGRFVVWEIAKKGFFEKPILGWGPENFNLVFYKYFNPCLGTPRCGEDVWYDRAHNIILDTLATTGILGFISYLFIFITSFYFLWEGFKKGKIDFWTANCFSSLLIAYFLQNLTVFDMISSYLMFFLTLGFVASFEKREEKEKIKPLNPLLVSFFLFLFLISFFEFVIFPTISSTSVISAIRLPNFSEERLNLYKKALSLSPIGRTQIRQFFIERDLMAFRDQEKWGKNIQKTFDFLIEEIEKSIKNSPLDFKSYLELSKILNVYSVFDSSKIPIAKETIEKAIKLSPKNQRGYWELAQNMLYQRKFDEAIALAQKALDLEPRLENSHIILIKILKFVGKEDLARKKFEEAIKINPDWREDLEPLFE